MWDSKLRSVRLNHLTDQISIWLITSRLLCQWIVVNFIATDSLQTCRKETLILRIPFLPKSYRAFDLSRWTSRRGGAILLIYLVQNVFLSSCIYKQYKQSHVHTHTHTQTMRTLTLPIWLLGETTPRVCCVFIMTVTTIQRAPRREWEWGKCKKTVLNKICQSVCS